MQYLVLGVTTIVVDIIVMIGYATLAQRISAWIKGPKQMKALNKVFGSLFMLVGRCSPPPAMPESWNLARKEVREVNDAFSLREPARKVGN